MVSYNILWPISNVIYIIYIGFVQKNVKYTPKDNLD